MDFTVTDQEAIDLSVDDLALSILRDVASNRTWNSGNWMTMAAQSGEYSAPALRCLTEAWSWLYRNGLVADDLAKNNALYGVIVTRLGEQVAKDGPAAVQAQQRLALDLHPELEKRVRKQYLMGEYELASFAALKAVEVRTRELAHLPDSLLGVKLMRSAFGEAGPLREAALDPGEQVARMELFAGAIGLFKNPTSHRDVEYDDPVEAAEVILVADLLMRLLDRIQHEVETRERLEGVRQVASALGEMLRPRRRGGDVPS